VDVFGQRETKWERVQSKQKDGLLRSRLTIKELEAEVEAAKKFKPPLASICRPAHKHQFVGRESRASCARSGSTPNPPLTRFLGRLRGRKTAGVRLLSLSD